MQTILKKLRDMYSSRGSCVALLSILAIMLFAAAASEAQGPPPPPILVSNTSWFTIFPAGGVLAGDTAGGSSWGINSSGVAVASTTYGAEIVQFSGPGYAETVVGPEAGYYGAGGVTIDSSNNLYVATANYSVIVKIPANTNGTYTMATDPSIPADVATLPVCTGIAKTDTKAGECLVPMAGDPNAGTYGITSMVFDAHGDLFIATDDLGGGTVPYTIFECTHTCLYGSTSPIPAPVQIFAEPVSTSVGTTGQLYIGTMGFDPWGNLFFTDDAQSNKNGTEVSSYLKELVYNATAKTFAAPVTLVTFTDNPVAQYDDQIDTLYVDPTLGTVYFALANEGIFALPNTQTGGVNTAGLYGVTSQGAKLMTADAYGNLYIVANSSVLKAYTDTFGYIAFTGPTFAASTSAVTSNLIVADNSEPCTPTVTLTFTPASGYTSVPGACSGMTAVGDTTGSFIAEAVTYTPSGTAPLAPTSSLVVTDTTSNASTSLLARGPALSINQNTLPLAATSEFDPPGAGSSGTWSAQSSDGSSGGINSVGVVVIGSSYGSELQEFTAGGTIRTSIGLVTNTGIGGTAIDTQDYLYASSEYNNTIYKFPMLTDGSGTYAPYTTLTGLPTCTGDGSAVDKAGACQIVLGADLFFGVTAITFDKNGNLFFSTNSEKPPSGNTNTYVPFSIFKCGATCLYGATPTDPVLLWSEPAANSVGQLYIGSVAVDTNDNVFFNDSQIDTSGSQYSHYSDLYELKTSTGTGFSGASTGYAAAPTLLETLTPACAAPPCTYNNEITSVSVDPKTNDVYFADVNSGIYKLVNTAGTLDAANPIPVATPGADALIPDGKGNFYYVGYVNTPGADFLGFEQIGSVTVAGTATGAAPTTATVNAVDSFPCAGSASLTYSFLDAEFTVPATGPTCGTMAFGGGSAYSTTVTFTPSASASGPVSTTLTVDDANGGTATAAVTATAQSVTPQAITQFAGITSPVTFGGGPYTLSATGGLSGNPVVFTIDGTSTIASISGTTLTVTGAGSFTIDANQAAGTAGGVNYSAAPQVQVPITVNKAPQTITGFAGITSPVAFGGGPYTLSATGGASTSPVVFTIDGTSTIASITGSTLTITGIGSFTIDVNQAGNANYTAAAQVQVPVTVNVAGIVATPTITPATGATLVIGSSSDSVTIADATTGAAIYYTLDGSTPTTSSTPYTAGTPITFSTAGSFTVNAIAVLANYTTSAVGTATYTVTTVLPTFTIAATPTTATVTTNVPASIAITVAPSITFTSGITFSCTGTGVTCIFSPAILPAGSTTDSLTIFKTTAAAHNGPNPFLPGGVTFAIALGFLGWKKRRGLFLAFVVMASIVCLTQLTACSSSSKGTTSTVTVTATGGSVTQTLPLTITVK